MAGISIGPVGVGVSAHKLCVGLKTLGQLWLNAWDSVG